MERIKRYLRRSLASRVLRVGGPVLCILLFGWLGRTQASNIIQSAYNLVKNGGSALTQRNTLNCGSGLTCTDDAINNWTNIAGTGGTVTSVSFTGGLISVANPTTTPALTVAGTSGGIPYFSGAATWASSAALGSGQFVLGGGAGNPPTASFSVVPLANGGTNAALTADNGAIPYSTGSAIALLAHTTTSGLPLLSGNAAAPIWASLRFNGGIIYPVSDSTTAVQIDKADGTTNVITIDTTNGRMGIGVTPTVPLDFAAVTGEKLSLYSGGGYSVGVESNEMRFNITSSAGRYTFNTGSAYSSPTNRFIINQTNATFPGRISNGTRFTISGCSADTLTGGATAGSFISRTTGTCTVVITMNGATGITAPNGWACSAADTTTPANIISQVAPISTTTCTLSGTTITGDVIPFQASGY